MHLSVILFDGFTALDVVGGYEVLSRVPDIQVEFVAEEPDLISADTRRLGLAAYRSLNDLETTDILYVPGGPGVERLLANDRFLDRLAALHATTTWTVGICNGVGLLGAAGLVEGRRVATNWGWYDRIGAYGAIPTGARYEIDDKLVTGAGVSASIDTALVLTKALAGEEVMRLVQLGIEYYPAPPSPDTTVREVGSDARELVLAYEDSVAIPLLTEPPAWHNYLEVRALGVGRTG
ncbi:DJ-1/PfpI family protein [Mycolicibacterium elephantis]